MEFNPNNKVVKLCLQGMGMEEKGKREEASKLFLQAWNEATDDSEHFISAHYIVRYQKNVSDKLKWLETALQLALKINNDAVKSAFPSLYSNIAKCHEDLNDPDKAKRQLSSAEKHFYYVKVSYIELASGHVIVSGDATRTFYHEEHR
jgi:rifampin ADP-ribosylating transferase